MNDQSRKARHCPTCESPDPALHPAVQFEGEVHECGDTWHTDPQPGGELVNDPLEPPRPRYRLTLTVTGNTLDEIENELVSQTRGGFLLDSGYHERHSWTSYSGRVTSVMEHVDPDMTPERYETELDEWWRRRKAARAATRQEASTGST